MVRRIPSATGGALADATQSFLDVSQARRQLALLEREVDVRERGQALTELTSMIPLVREGEPLHESRALHRSFQRLWPDLDPTDPEDVGGLILNPETMESVVMKGMLQEFENLPDDERQRLLQSPISRAVFKLATGEPLSPEESDLLTNRAEIGMQALNAWQPSTEEALNIARANLGLDPVTPVVDLLTGEVLGTFETETAAALAVELLKARFGLFAASTRQQEDIVGEFMGQMKDAGVVISRAVATEIINTVHSGDPDRLQAFAERFNDVPNAVQALQVYLHGARIADEYIGDWLGRFEGGEQFHQSIRILSEVTESLGAAETAKIYRDLLHAFFNEGGRARGTLQRSFDFFNRRGAGAEALTGARRPEEEASQELPAGPPVMPGDATRGAEPRAGVPETGAPSAAESGTPEEAMRILSAFQAIRSGDMSIGQLRRQGFTPEQIRWIMEALDIARREGGE